MVRIGGPEEGKDVRKEPSLDSDHSTSGTGRGGLGKHLSIGREGFCYLEKAVWY